MRAKTGAQPRIAVAPGTPLTVEAANAQAESAVAPPMLNDPGRWEREARRSPIAPRVTLLDALTLPTAVPASATAVPFAGLTLPLVVGAPSLRVVPVVVASLEASPDGSYT